MKNEPGYAYESEIDALMRKMRQDPKIEAERQRNWMHWWQPEPAKRDADTLNEVVETQSIERDMAYTSRRSQPQGGRK
ncbi:MAG: hypothetical protein Q8L39_14290 [Burkholderiales bacterium]|nr:hypothetical protein [Burkholderiales bacterium]